MIELLDNHKSKKCINIIYNYLLLESIIIFLILYLLKFLMSK